MSNSMKVAFATRDGETITGHFGRAKVFVVADINDGVEIGRERRAVDAGGGLMQIGSARSSHDDGHHDGLLGLIDDCDIVVGGGMGRPMANRIAAAGLDVILTGERSIDAAIAALVAGTLNHEPDLAHAPDH